MRNTGAEKKRGLPLLAVAEEAQEVEEVRVETLRGALPLREQSLIIRGAPEKTTYLQDIIKELHDFTEQIENEEQGKRQAG
ncbi:MAG: hypothetical protein ACI4OZ_03620, partial [Akkermansia sp.]